MTRLVKISACRQCPHAEPKPNVCECVFYVVAGGAPLGIAPDHIPNWCPLPPSPVARVRQSFREEASDDNATE